MWIFNRFGECVFYTEEIDQGWDGFYRDIPAPEGVYVWKIHYLDATGKYHDRFGTVTLLRK